MRTLSSIFFDQHERAETTAFIGVSEPSPKLRLVKCGSEVVRMDTETVERRYALTRVRAGDYLLPSNDGKTIWRIKAYDEDGSAQYQDERGWHPILGHFWAVWRYVGRSVERLDPDDWTDWEQWDSSYRTRAEAVRCALRVAS
jgi:hypothetical protein